MTNKFVPKQSTPLPQQELSEEEKDALIDAKFEQGYCALSQQEEPATKCIHCGMTFVEHFGGICATPEGKWFQLSESPTSLLGQDEPKLLGRSKSFWLEHIDELFATAESGEDIPEYALLYAWSGSPNDEDKKWAKTEVDSYCGAERAAAFCKLIPWIYPKSNIGDHKVLAENLAMCDPAALTPISLRAVELQIELTQALTSLAAANSEIDYLRDGVISVGNQLDAAESKLAAAQKEIEELKRLLSIQRPLHGVKAPVPSSADKTLIVKAPDINPDLEPK